LLKMAAARTNTDAAPAMMSAAAPSLVVLVGRTPACCSGRPQYAWSTPVSPTCVTKTFSVGTLEATRCALQRGVPERVV
jgi:hypothetical protein